MIFVILKTTEIINDEIVTIEEYDITDEEFMLLDIETDKALTKLFDDVLRTSEIEGLIFRIPDTNTTRVRLTFKEAIAP